MAPLKILIIGCSIAGPALAICLLLSDLPDPEKPHITVLERAPALRPEGQNIDVRGAGITILKKLGLEAAVRARTTGEEGVRWVDGADRAWASFAADRSGRTSTPTADVEILRGALADVLCRRARTLGAGVAEGGGRAVEFVFGDRLDRVEQDGAAVRVRFARSGEERAYDLVVGADGLQSATRGMVWGGGDEGGGGEAGRVQRLAGGVYGAFFSMPAGETDTMWRRWYRAPGRRAVMVRPGARRDRTTVFMSVVSDSDERLAAVPGKRREDVPAQKELMREYFEGAGWECDRIVREMMATEDFYYDMIAQVKMDRWTKGRVALLGDAGYCASPFSGMGTTLALTGAWNLAGAILQHPDDHARAFAEYERTMRPVVDRAQKLAPGIPKGFHPETAWGVWMLNAFAFVLDWSGLIWLATKLGAGPPAHFVPVEDYGFRELPEMAE